MRGERTDEQRKEWSEADPGGAAGCARRTARGARALQLRGEIIGAGCSCMAKALAQRLQNKRAFLRMFCVRANKSHAKCRPS